MPRKRMFMRKNNTKLNNQTVVIDGIEFQSKKEGNRYLELKLLQIAGKISDLELQKRYELIPAQYEVVETGECRNCDYSRNTNKGGKIKTVCALNGKCKGFSDYYKGVWDNVYKWGYSNGYQKCKEECEKVEKQKARLKRK